MNARIFLWVCFALLLLGAYTASSIIDLMVDYAWFGAVGYREVFTTMVGAKVSVAAVGIMVAFVALFANIVLALRQVGDFRQLLPSEALNTPIGNQLGRCSSTALAAGVSMVLAVMSGVALAANWEEVLLFSNAVPFGHVDPIFGLDASFYVFKLPFFQLVQSYVSSLAFLALIASVVVYYFYFQSQRATMPTADELTLLLATPAAPTAASRRHCRSHAAGVGGQLLSGPL